MTAEFLWPECRCSARVRVIPGRSRHFCSQLILYSCRVTVAYTQAFIWPQAMLILSGSCQEYQSLQTAFKTNGCTLWQMVRSQEQCWLRIYNEFLCLALVPLCLILLLLFLFLFIIILICSSNIIIILIVTYIIIITDT